ncbi:MAG: elongation factor 1-beta [Candidatus Pacearchaeota archaeon]|nr:elongation factor 1-beta [Candidatus Pacearchaeota archaeon]
MAVVGIKLKILPESIEALEIVKASIESKLISMGAIKISSIEEEPIAFGLKALIITFAWPEEKETSLIDEMKLEGISSLEIIDYRRAFG